VGVGLIAAGVLGTAIHWPTSSVVSLLIVGVVCLFLALTGDRIRSFRANVLKGQIDFGVDPDLTPQTVEELNDAGLKGFAATYAFIHNQFADIASPELNDIKVKLQDEIVRRVKQNSFTRAARAEDVRAAVESGSPAERVLAFALIQGDPDLGSLKELEGGVLHSKSANEQYQALLAAEASIPKLESGARFSLDEAIRKAPYICKDSDRRTVAQRILTKLEDNKGATAYLPSDRVQDSESE
jgi:hypothetical protein